MSQMPDVMQRPRIDPRIAQRWIDARRAEGRHRLKILIGVGAVVAVVALAFGLLYTPLFEVNHVRAEVDGPLSPAQVIGLTGLNHHPLMMDVSPGAVAARVEADPWLGAARVKRSWPDTVDLSVVVRSPVAVVAAGPGRWAEVDLTGRVLVYTTAGLAPLPLLTGPEVGPIPSPGGWLTGSPGSRVDPRLPVGSVVDMSAASDGADVPGGVTAALATVAGLPAAIRADVSTVSIGPAAALILAISPFRVAAGTIQVKLGDGSDLQAKLDGLVTFLTQSDLSGVSAIDLSVPDRPAALTARP